MNDFAIAKQISIPVHASLKSRKKKKKRKQGRRRVAIEYAILRFAAATMGRLPIRSRLKLAGTIGWLMARVVPIRRRVAESNLQIAFPEWSQRQMRALLPEAYANLVLQGLDVLALHRSSREAVLAEIQNPLDATGKLDGLRQSGKGFIIVTGHFGSWEWAGATLTGLGLNLLDVAKPLHNKASERFVSEIRARHGIQIVTTRESPRRLISHLRKGGVVSLFSDQDAGKDGLFVDFFGKPASTVEGAARLAYRLGVPILPIWGERTPEGKLRGIAGDIIEADPAANQEEEVRRITQFHVKMLEEVVRRHPAQYLWFHRRWKSSPRRSSAGGVNRPKPETESPAISPAAPSDSCPSDTIP